MANKFVDKVSDGIVKGVNFLLTPLKKMGKTKAWFYDEAGRQMSKEEAWTEDEFLHMIKLCGYTPISYGKKRYNNVKSKLSD
jgi:hypothetical protein